MRIYLLRLFCILMFLVSNSRAEEYLDVSEAIDFEHPESLSDQTFIISLGKSGTNLLTSSIIQLTKRPVRTLFPGLPLTNILNLDLDFSKPTMYFGHDYFGKKISAIESCKDNGNKLIMTHRNYKENILSYLVLSNGIKSLENDNEKLEKAFLDEILNERVYFELYIERLLVFDNWPAEYRFLVNFEDLVKNPQDFFPELLSFLGENECDYTCFVDNYDSFKDKLHSEYSKSDGYTGSRANLNYFRSYISKEALIQADNYVKTHYPNLWENYLKGHSEIK